MDIVDYWNRRYRMGEGSGAGSRGRAARRKAAYVNGLLEDLGVSSIVDWGCGDGEVLSLLDLTGRYYVGIDGSAEAVRLCLQRFPKLQFIRMDTRQDWLGEMVSVRAELALSMDVVFHFPNEADLWSYLDYVFTSARRFVLFHATDHDTPQRGSHLKHRQFTTTVQDRYPGWSLQFRPDRSDKAGFYLYKREPGQ